MVFLRVLRRCSQSASPVSQASLRNRSAAGAGQRTHACNTHPSSAGVSAVVAVRTGMATGIFWSPNGILLTQNEIETDMLRSDRKPR